MGYIFFIPEVISTKNVIEKEEMTIINNLVSTALKVMNYFNNSTSSQTAHFKIKDRTTMCQD